MSEQRTVHGRCHCGAIEFEAEVDPERVVICHCTDCQVMSGSAFRAVVFSLPDAFHLKAGEPKTYVKTAQSGNKRAQVFCEDCGAALYATAVGDGPKVYGIRTGVLHERSELSPTLQIWRDSALEWVDELHGLASIPGQP